MAEGLRERNKRLKLERARKAARELFLRQGFEATTIRQIAQRAGIGLGTLYSYVPNKHELLEQLFYEQWSLVEDEAYASLAPEAGLVDALLHVFTAMLDGYAREPELSRTYLRETLLPTTARPGMSLERSTRVMARLAELVARARERGEVDRQVDASLAAANVFGLYLLHLVSWLAGVTSPEQFREGLRASLELHLRGLRPELKSRTRSN